MDTFPYLCIDQQQARGIPHNQSGAGEGERPSVEEEGDDDDRLRGGEEGLLCLGWSGKWGLLVTVREGVLEGLFDTAPSQ